MRRSGNESRWCGALCSRSSVAVLWMVFVIALFAPLTTTAQEQRILDAVKAAKAEKRTEITVAGSIPHYFAAGTLEQVIQKNSALLLRSERVAAHAVWADWTPIVTWHTFTIESRLWTNKKVADLAHDPTHGHKRCDETRHALGFDGVRLRSPEIALYFPGGSLPVDGVVVHVSGWQRLWPVAQSRYLVFGELCDDARSIELSYGPESWFRVSTDGVITPVVNTPFTAEIARLGTIRNLRTRLNTLSR